MAQSNVEESDVFALFATSVWKVRLAPEVFEGTNRAVRASLAQMNPQLSELAPGEQWRSDASESDEQRISVSFNLMFSSSAQNMSKPMWAGRR